MKRDRPAKRPCGLICQKCREPFTGEETHLFCAICIEEVAHSIAVKQGLS